MDTNDDFYGKELNLNCFYMHSNFEQKYPKTAIVHSVQLLITTLRRNKSSLVHTFKENRGQ